MDKKMDKLANLTVTTLSPLCRTLSLGSTTVEYTNSIREARHMKGSMRQRGDAQLRVYVGRDPLTGEKRWTSKTVKGGKREAQRALAAMLASADRSGVAPSCATVGELLQRWYENVAADLSPKTALETKGMIDRYLKLALGSVPLARLRTEDIDRPYRELRLKVGATANL
jgi:integrase